MKKMKLISLMCVVVMLFGCFSSVLAYAETTPAAWTAADGAGEAGKSYALNQDNFKAFCEANLNSAEINGNYILTEDVTVFPGDASTWHELSHVPTGAWTTAVGRVFKGTFDGNGKTISGVCIVAKKADTKVALFERVEGTVKNLRIVNSYFESAANATAAEAAYTTTGGANAFDTPDLGWFKYRDENNLIDESKTTTSDDGNTVTYFDKNGVALWLPTAETITTNVDGQEVTKPHPYYEGFWKYWDNYIKDTNNIPSHDSHTNARYVETASIAARVSGGTVTNCYSEAIINNKNTVSNTYTQDLITGGVVGMMGIGANVNKCVFAGEIKNSLGTTGGVVGVFSTYARELVLKDCLNIGSITTIHDRTGAMLGWDKSLSGTVDTCMNLSVKIYEGGPGKIGTATMMYGSGANYLVTFKNYVLVSGMKLSNNAITSGNQWWDAKKWSINEITVVDLFNEEVVSNSGVLPGWSYNVGYVPNPTTHTKITLDQVFNATTFGLTTDTNSIRISSENAGLRFETKVKNTELVSYLKAAGIGVEMNTLITAAKYYNGYQDSEYFGQKVKDLTKANLEAKNLKFVTTTASKYLRTMNVDGYNAFSGAIVNINDKKMDYVGRGYLTLKFGDKTYDIYATWAAGNTVNVSDFATSEINDTVEKADKEYKNAVTTADGKTVYSRYNQVQYDCISKLIVSAP